MIDIKSDHGQLALTNVEGHAVVADTQSPQTHEWACQWLTALSRSFEFRETV